MTRRTWQIITAALFAMNVAAAMSGYPTALINAAVAAFMLFLAVTECRA